jgi:hypothetical protein
MVLALRRDPLHLRTPTRGLKVQTRLPGPDNARNVAAVAALSDLVEVDWAGWPGRRVPMWR